MSFPAMLQTIGYALATAFILGLIAVITRYFGLWLRGWVTGAGISLASLFFMSLRGVSPSVIVDAQVMSVQAGLPRMPTQQLEAHFLAGGDVLRLTRALIVAHRARIPLTWDAAAAIELAGRNVLEAVRVSVTPDVIECPDPETGQTTLDAIARDGIQLKVRARVTVRTNLLQLIGGATERTIVARVGEGIVSAIGSCETWRAVLEKPQVIVRRILEADLDSQTAFALVSVDIADITVGENIGARLQIDQAAADQRVARARAEERRAMAIARHQEMVALTVENQAVLVEAQAEVPSAVAGAFRAGNLGNRTRSPRLQLAKDCSPALPTLRR